MKQDPKYQAKWLKLINEYKISNETMKTFCLDHDVKVYQLQYWLKKYKQSSTENKIEFTEVNVIKQPITKKPIKVISGNLIIEIPNNFNERTLLKLLKVVDQLV